MGPQAVLRAGAATGVTGRAWPHVALAALGAGGALALFLFDPATSRLFPPCPLRSLTGILCPGCGTLRATHQLLHGHLVAAFRLNPLLVCSLPFLGWSLASDLWTSLTGREVASPPAPPWRAWLVLGVILAFWVVRNTRFYPPWLLPL